MSEVPRSVRIAHRASLGVVAAIMAGSLSGSADATPLPVEFSTCYDNPASIHPRQMVDTGTVSKPDVQPAASITPITIRQDSGKAAEGYAGPMPEEVTSKVKGAAIKIQRGEKSGSGAVVTNGRGERVVITAAHVVKDIFDTTDAPLVLTDTSGHQAEVVSGCLVNGSEGMSSPPGDATPEHIDFAILRTSRALGTTALSFASKPPRRGETIGFYNFQQGRSVDDPANYSGIALDVRSPYVDNTVLTGLGAEDDRKMDNRITPGASGGPALNYYTGELYGLSVSMGIRPHEKMDQYGIRYDSFVSSTADESVFAGMVDAANIQRGLAEGKY